MNQPRGKTLSEKGKKHYKSSLIILKTRNGSGGEMVTQPVSQSIFLEA